MYPNKFKARWLVLLSVIFGLTVTSVTPAYADPFVDAVQALNAKSNKAKTKAIEALVATGDERAAAVLGAFLNGKLFYRKADKRVFITEKSGSVYVLTDPATGKEAGEEKKSKIKKIPINNKLRGQLKGVLGAMTLMSADIDKRRHAADEVFKANDPSMLPVLEKALVRED